MVKRRAKRKSGALNRYLQNGNTALDNSQFTNLEVKNPFKELEKKDKFIPQVKDKKPEVKQEQEIKLPFIPSGQEIKDFDENQMPLFCNYCDMRKTCPDGRKAITRKDQKELIVCTRRKEFAMLIKEAHISDRQGLINYMRKLRQVNALRIGRAVYKEALANDGIDKNLSVLIDKQIDHATSEYKLLTPTEKNQGNFSFHLTTIHNTVDAFNELPTQLKTYVVKLMRAKLEQLKSNSITIPTPNNDSLNTKPDTIPHPKQDNIPNPNEVRVSGGKVVSEPDNSISKTIVKKENKELRT